MLSDSIGLVLDVVAVVEIPQYRCVEPSASVVVRTESLLSLPDKLAGWRIRRS